MNGYDNMFKQDGVIIAYIRFPQMKLSQVAPASRTHQVIEALSQAILTGELKDGEHGVILAAVEAQDAVRAEVAMRAHLQAAGTDLKSFSQGN